jgi:two-component system, chemotaxis family, protein-glutamate methylesterase/glutaminase
MSGPVRVLIVDDSALVRQIIRDGLAKFSDVEVVGTAPDPFVARDKIVQLKPDVMTLDVEMPRMDGVEFLRRLMPQYPMPVIMVSSLTQRGSKITLDALEAGAVDYVSKPSAVSTSIEQLVDEIHEKVLMASKANVKHLMKSKAERRAAPKPRASIRALAESTDKVIAIGASTGGTEALKVIAEQLPGPMPGVVVVQHMPGTFTKVYAERIDGICAMDVKEAETGDRIRAGRMLIAPGGKQMRVVRSGGNYEVVCTEEERVCGHMPSVDVLFRSVAKEVGGNAIGVMLTGMGSDGADAMLEMKRAGAKTIAQDEASCVVFGMPKEAIARGGVDIIKPIDDIASVILAELK